MDKYLVIIIVLIILSLLAAIYVRLESKLFKLKDKQSENQVEEGSDAYDKVGNSGEAHALSILSQDDFTLLE